VKSILSETRNANFLDQELRFFIDNLQQKAVENGMQEDSLIPQKTAHDKHIYKFLMKSRPQSGMKMQSNKDEALDVKTPQIANTPAR
jgi:hypothetical protein